MVKLTHRLTRQTLVTRQESWERQRQNKTTRYWAKWRVSLRLVRNYWKILTL